MNMIHCLAPVAVLGAVAVTAAAVEAGSAPAAPKKAKKLLVVSHTTGFRHSSIGPANGSGVAQKVLEDLGKESGDFSVDLCLSGDDVKKMLTPDYLKAYDGVFFANTTGDLGIPDLPAFLEWIKSGKAFLGAHSASDTYHNEPAFIEMIGGEFKTHGAQCEIEAKVEDTKHPATQHLGSTYKVFDEIYILKNNPREKHHVLLSLDRHPPDKSPEAGTPGDFQIAWCKEYGKGRVFYTALGHREDVWESEPYKKHLLGAIQWAFGLKKGSAKPQPPVKAAR